MSEQILPRPCAACPYRLDVPSGVWAEEEYDKLPAYDRRTMSQPPAPFMCHEAREFLCHGWAVCHSRRGHENELLALRMLGVEPPDAGRFPLFSSGQAACEHGKQDIECPGPKAVATIKRLSRKLVKR